MRGHRYLVLFTVVAIAAVPLLGVGPGVASSDQQAIVSESIHHDHSIPLRSMRAASAHTSRRLVPHRLLRQNRATGVTPAADGALQHATTAPVRHSLQAGSVNFDGIGDGVAGYTVSSAPPDTIGAVGPNHYVQVVNTAVAIYSKIGTLLFGPVPTNTLWSGFGGGCQTNNDGDGGVQWDPQTDRWIIHQFSVSTTPYLECVAVSQTADPTGAYNRYAFSYGTNFPDYPKLGVWNDAYYFTFNMFNSAGTTFLGAKACAYDRARMLAGLTATQQCFNTSPSIGGALAGNLQGPTPPPIGEPETVAALGANANELATYKFHVDWTTSTNSTFVGPTTLATPTFTQACGGGTCIAQLGTTNQLDSLGDRLMNSLVYRNFGDHESLVVNHSVAVGSGSGVRWYELRLGATGTVSIFQAGTYAPDSASRWMGSVAFDASGDIAVGYSHSSSTAHPGIRLAGRSSGDALGNLTSGEQTMFTGAGSQTATLSRWGDYSQITVDPSDDCTFWYTNEYIPTNGTFNWRTRIATYKFSECTTSTDNFSITATPPNLNIGQGTAGTSTISTATTLGNTQTVNLSVAGMPAGVTATLTPTNVTSGNSATLNISVGPNTPIGTSTLTITGTGTATTRSTNVILTITTPSTGYITNGGFETGLLTPWTKTGPTVVVPTGYAGAYSVQTGTTTVGTIKTSTVNQTLTLPIGTHTLTYSYQQSCPDTITHDWANATIRDLTALHTYNVQLKTCINDGLWHQITYDLTPMAGHKIRLTLSNHDNLIAGTATHTNWDAITIN